MTFRSERITIKGMDMDSDVYKVGTSNEVAEMWGVSTQAITQAIFRGKLESRKSGDRHLVAFSDAEKYFGRPPAYYPSPESDSDSTN